MTTPTTPTALESKYHLKTLHADIDLYDRRLAHVLKFEVFATEAARAAAASQPKVLSSRRANFRAPSDPKAFPHPLKLRCLSPSLQQPLRPTTPLKIVLPGARVHPTRVRRSTGKSQYNTTCRTRLRKHNSSFTGRG